MIQRFFNGFGYILRGRQLLKQAPHLKKWAIMPFFIDVLVLIVFLYAGFSQTRAWIYQLALQVMGASEYFNFFYYPLLIIFWCLAILLSFYFVYVFATLIASPFNSVLAEQSLRHLGTINTEGRSLKDTVMLSARMLSVSLLKAVVFIFVAMTLFVLSFIPGLNLLAIYAVFVILALDAIDYSFEAMGFNLRQRLAFFKKHLIEFCGMGAFVGLTAFVPGLTLLLMPVSVVGAACLFHELRKSP